MSADIKSMTNEELKEELSALGSPVGPIMPSTRGLYERKLGKIFDCNVQSNFTIQHHTCISFVNVCGFSHSTNA